MEAVAILTLITIIVLVFTVRGCYAVFKKNAYFLWRDVNTKYIKLKKEHVKRNKTIAYCSIALSIVLIVVTGYIASITRSYDDKADGHYWHDGSYYEKEEVNDAVGMDIFD